MKASAEQQCGVIVMVLILFLSLIVPGICFSEDVDGKQRIAKELTREFQNDGFSNLTFEAPATDTVLIRHAGIVQEKRLTDGQLVTALGTILEPNVVSRLKNAGFTKAVFVDGKSRKYPVELSTKYYYKLQAFFKKLSGGK